MSANAASMHDAGHDQATLHAVLRFAVGVTITFVLCEALQWTPSFLAPVLTAVVLANVPVRPPIKMSLALVVTMAAAALFAFGLASLLRGTPTVLFGLIALCMFLSFHAMASGRARLPAMLLLICLVTIPVVVMIAPAQAGILPVALIRGIVLALLAATAVHGLWPVVRAPAPVAAATPGANTPLVMALISTAVVAPLMLFYLLFGLADVLPVMTATVMIVMTFDPRRSGMQALGMVLGNFAGGLLGLLVHTALLTTPSLTFLALLLFLVLVGFGQRVAAGGAAAAVAVVACNAMLIILGSAIASGPGTLSLWLTRVFLFALAGAFAVAMMNLIWYRVTTSRSASSLSAHHPSRSAAT